MENKLNKLYELEKETRNLQEEVLKDLINKAKKYYHFNIFRRPVRQSIWYTTIK